MLIAAGLGCLCGSVSVFTTKTSGVQHQIQDDLVVFVDHLNVVLLLLSSFKVMLLGLVGAWKLANPLDRGVQAWSSLEGGIPLARGFSDFAVRESISWSAW